MDVPRRRQCPYVADERAESDGVYGIGNARRIGLCRLDKRSRACPGMRTFWLRFRDGNLLLYAFVTLSISPQVHELFVRGEAPEQKLFWLRPARMTGKVHPSAEWPLTALTASISEIAPEYEPFLTAICPYKS